MHLAPGSCLPWGQCPTHAREIARTLGLIWLTWLIWLIWLIGLLELIPDSGIMISSQIGL